MLAPSIVGVMRVVASLVMLGALTEGAVQADEVQGAELPGYARPFPHQTHYSGYVTTAYPGRSGVVVHTHYYLVLHEDPATPLVQWQQGGPGGSSLIGMLTEMGPLTLNDASFGGGGDASTPRVFDHVAGWQNVTGGASLLFLEHPAPTGFSYCEPADACGHTDESQAALHLAVLEAFFSDDMYPELAARRYVMSGESYAGVLVPTVALAILEKRAALGAAARSRAPYSLEGFALGNDCPGNRVFTCTPYSGWAGTQVSLDFLHGHGMISDAKKRDIDAACAGWYEVAPPGPQSPPPPRCAAALEDPIRPAKSFAGDTYDMGGGYFLYDACASDLRVRSDGGGARERPPLRPTADAVRRAARLLDGDAYANDAGEYACGQENAAAAWLNAPSVQAALHVKPQTFHFSTGLNYNFTRYSLLDAYNATLIKEFRIMQYSGDADPCVPHVGTQRWIASLAMPVDRDWRPYTAPGTMAVTGYVTTYLGGDFTFATVRDAGHMAPRYKPRELLYLFDQWLQKKPI